jgi:parallel beta-helix repeat protein
MARRKVLWAAIATAALLALPAVAHGKVIKVNPGDSIQAAVDKANPGDTVAIAPGTYSESSKPCPSEPGSSCAVVVQKDGISIVGLDAEHGHGDHGNQKGKSDGRARRVVLEAGANQDLGISVGKSAGPACLTDPALRVRGSLIRNINVQGFADDGVFLYCVRHWRITEVVAQDNAEYAIFPSHSFDGRVDHSFASGANDTGFYVGQSFNSRMDHNVATGNLSGYEIENSTGVSADHNVSIGNTAGMLSFTLPFLDVNENENNVISHNLVRNNNRPNTCSDPSDIVCTVPSGTGILLVAADDNSVRHNRVTGNRSFGIAVTNICVGQQLPEAVCSALDIQPDSDGNRVVANTVTKNGQNPDPSVPPLFVQDLVWDTTGVGNCWSNNVFGTSFPSPLPSC